jgi:hypothetical protein
MSWAESGPLTTFSVRGGPHDGVAALAAEWSLDRAVRRAGARLFSHDHATNVSTFVVDAATPGEAFAAAGDVFRPAYGTGWWAEIASIGCLN